MRPHQESVSGKEKRDDDEERYKRVSARGQREKRGYRLRFRGKIKRKKNKRLRLVSLVFFSIFVAFILICLGYYYSLTCAV